MPGFAAGSRPREAGVSVPAGSDRRSASACDGALVTLARRCGSLDAVVGVRSLRSQAEAEALTRVELAVSAAREGLRQSTEDLLTAARILGERPPLQRLLRGSIRDALPPISAGYCETRRSMRARSPKRRGDRQHERRRSNGRHCSTAADEQGERFLVTGAAAEMALSGAAGGRRRARRRSGRAVRRMDERLAARLAERAGVEIRHRRLRLVRAGRGPARDLEHRRAVARRARRGVHRRARLVRRELADRRREGETIALVQGLLPADACARPVAGSTRANADRRGR